jgi:hypothetical protein
VLRAEIPFGRLDRREAEQRLDLLKRATCGAAQARGALQDRLAAEPRTVRYAKRAALLQLRVFRSGPLENWDTRIGVFPERQEIPIRACLETK